ncbi:MAG: LLM class F420-dependent oxidoreductase, partial [Chloroflexota bacterium]|nr:LLM class F420-dependent oxidoreductase [Chloroflexota bacterium]
VGLSPRARADGTLDPGSLTAGATARKITWVREAAGNRLGELEINVYVYAVEVATDREAAAERLAPAFGLPADEILGSPHALIGPVELMAEQLQERRERFGISYVVVGNDLIDELAPVVARVAGT